MQEEIPEQTSELLEDQEEFDQEEEEESCGFCIFMKGGGCKDAFETWSKCVDSERSAENDYTETCREATLKLRECMLEHKDYYAPLLEEEERLEKDIALQSGSQHEEEQADSS